MNDQQLHPATPRATPPAPPPANLHATSPAVRRATPRSFAATTLTLAAVLSLAAALPMVAGCTKEDAQSETARAPGGGGKRPGGRHGGPHGAGRRPGAGAWAQQPPIPVAVARAHRGAIASHYAATASLAAEKQAEVLARATGIVGAITCEEGDQVAAGALLLRIDNDEYRLRLAQAEANTANLTARHHRLEGMLAKDLVSAEEYETVNSELEAARAAEELARLDLSYTEVTAPFAGRVVNRLVDVGQSVSIGTSLFALADFEPLLARVHVPAREFRKLEPEQPVELVLDSTGAHLSGRIKLVSPVIEPTTGTIKVTIEVDTYPPGTRPGDFAEVRIVTERRSGVTLVPKDAVVTDRGDQVVFVAAADSTAERRVVEVGFENDTSAEIVSGVETGEPVVVKGQRSLKHGAPLRILEDGAAGHRRRPPGDAS